MADSTNYKDKYTGNYDYTLICSMPCDINTKTSQEPSYDQQVDAIEKFSENIKEALQDESYTKDFFKDIEEKVKEIKLKFEDITEEVIIRCNISCKDPDTTLDEEKLKETFSELVVDIIDNLDGVDVTGLGGNEDPQDDTEPCTVYLKQKGEPMTFYLTNILEDNCKNLKDIDRKLVSEGKLTFKKENKTYDIVLSDEGVMKFYKENKLKNSLLFSRVSLTKECKNLMQEGYKLDEGIQEDNKENIDVQKTKQELEQDIKDVDELQKLKDTLDDKVDNLMNESIDEDSEFPSSEITEKDASAFMFNDFNLEDELENEQKDWIQTHLNISCQELQDGFEALINELAYIKPSISINDYISYVIEDINKNN